MADHATFVAQSQTEWACTDGVLKCRQNRSALNETLQLYTETAKQQQQLPGVLAVFAPRARAVVDALLAFWATSSSATPLSWVSSMRCSNSSMTTWRQIVGNIRWHSGIYLYLVIILITLSTGKDAGSSFEHSLKLVSRDLWCTCQ